MKVAQRFDFYSDNKVDRNLASLKTGECAHIYDNLEMRGQKNSRIILLALFGKSNNNAHFVSILYQANDIIDANFFHNIYAVISNCIFAQE
jgi:hypothetical protein